MAAQQRKTKCMYTGGAFYRELGAVSIVLDFTVRIAIQMHVHAKAGCEDFSMPSSLRWWKKTYSGDPPRWLLAQFVGSRDQCEHSTSWARSTENTARVLITSEYHCQHCSVKSTPSLISIKSGR